MDVLGKLFGFSKPLLLVHKVSLIVSDALEFRRLEKKVWKCLPLKMTYDILHDNC